MCVIVCVIMAVVTFSVGFMRSMMMMAFVAMAPTGPTGPPGIGSVFRLKCLVSGVHDQVHGAQHVGQHMVGFNLQMVGLELNRHVAIAQMVGGANQVERCAVLQAVRNAKHGL